MTFLSPQTNILSSSYFLIQNPDLVTTIAAAQIMICQAAQVLGDLISVSLPLLKPVMFSLLQALGQILPLGVEEVAWQDNGKNIKSCI